jgi:hypothetical protein
MSDTKLRPDELFARFGEAGPQLYREAYRRGMSLSAYLDSVMETGFNDGLDSFERLLMAGDLVTVSQPEYGRYAERYERFAEDPNARALLPEWFARQYRKVAYQTPQQRAAFLSDDYAAGGWERPYAMADMLRVQKQLQAAIPLAALVGLTTPIDGNVYQAAYLNQTGNESSFRMVRVGESAQIPTMKVSTADRTINLHKYGRTLEASYETLRRQRMDKIALFIQLMAIQAEVDKVATVIDVVVNGDGNANTSAETHNLTTLDSGATAGTLTLKGWLAFQMEFENPYMLGVALATKAIALQVMLLSAGTANHPIVSFGNMPIGGVTPINQDFAGPVPLGWTSDAPADKIVGWDPRMTIERVFEIGADISEVERFTTKQTQTLTMTETEGYAVMDAGAAHILVVNA